MAALAPNTSSGPFTANGSQRAYPFTFTALNDFDVACLVDGMAVPKHLYTITLAKNGGTLNFISPPPAGRKVLIFSEPDFSQLSEFEDQGPYNLSTVNAINRRASVRDLYLKSGLARALKVPVGETAPVFPASREHPFKILGTDGDGDLAWVNLPPSALPRKTDPVEATAGQTTFPADGDFAFEYDPELLTVIVNGLIVPSTDYTAAGGTAPVVFNTPMIGPQTIGGTEMPGETVEFHSFLAVAGNPGDYLSTLRFSIHKSAQDKLNEVRSLDDARTSWASDQDGLALADLIDSGYRRIRAIGGRGVGTEKGEYLCGAEPFTGLEPGAPEGSDDPNDYIEAPGNLCTGAGAPAHGIHIFGDGPALTEFYQGARNYLFAHNSLSDDAEDNLKGLRLSDLTLRGGYEAFGAAEPVHILMLSGVDGFRAQNVHFKDARGDAVDFLMGPRTDTVRYNSDALFFDCLFDRAGRNAISFEAMHRAKVIASQFTRIQSTVTGAVQIEPRGNVAYQASDIHVRDSLFWDCLGGAVGIFANNPEYYELATTMFSVTGCDARNMLRFVDIQGGFEFEIMVGLIRHQIEVALNRLNDVETPLRCDGGFGVKFRLNSVIDADAIKLGANQTKGNREVSITDNEFVRAGRTTGPVIVADDQTKLLEVARNKAIDCGRPDNLGGWFFLQRYGDVDASVHDNEVQNPNGYLKAFAQVGGSAGTQLPTSEKYGNKWNGVAATSPDNFNPPPPPTGVRKVYTFTSTATITAGNYQHFDVTVPGAYIGQRFTATLNFTFSTDAMPQIDCVVFAANVVRVIIDNDNGIASLVCPTGQTMTVQEVA